MRNYSVAIRTLGTSSKYRRTLDSIQSQSIKPEEVIIVLPHGYSLPQERLGYERFVYSPKGMVSQRLASFEACRSEYILALDDDMEFQPDFVQRLFDTLEKQRCQFASPLVRETTNSGGGKSPLSNNIIDWLMGVSCRRKLNDDLMVKIWRTGGFIVNTNIRDNTPYFSQSGQGACVFGLTEAIRAIHFEDELWLEDTRYALPEDMVFFYKLHLNGNRIAVDRQTNIIHLDEGASIGNADKRLLNTYASARNGLIFWHRFVYSCQSRRWLSALCFARRVAFTSLFSLLKGMARRDFSQFRTYIAAYRNGFSFIRSDRYKRLRKAILTTESSMS